MLTWLGYIDGIDVTIYSSTMDPMGIYMGVYTTSYLSKLGIRIETHRLWPVVKQEHRLSQELPWVKDRFVSKSRSLGLCLLKMGQKRGTPGGTWFLGKWFLGLTSAQGEVRCLFQLKTMGFSYWIPSSIHFRPWARAQVTMHCWTWNRSFDHVGNMFNQWVKS